MRFSHRKPIKNRTSRRLQVESLETRTLMAADAVAVVRDGAGGFQDWLFDLNQDPTVEVDRVFGLNSDPIAVSGDWDGDGDTDTGVVRPEGGFWRWLLDTNGDPTAERTPHLYCRRSHRFHRRAGYRAALDCVITVRSINLTNPSYFTGGSNRALNTSLKVACVEPPSSSVTLTVT